MADATAPPTRREDAFDSLDAASRGLPLSRAPGNLIATIAWFVFAAGLILFLLFGSVPVEAGLWDGRRMRVSRIWSRFLDFLSDLGASPVAVAAVSAAVALALVGSVTLVWLAMRLRDQPLPSTSDIAPDS